MNIPVTGVRNPPQQIDSIKIPGVAGLIGITSCPGMRDEYVFDLYGDCLIEGLQSIRSWGAAVVVTLLEEAEIVSLGVRDLGKNVVAMDMVWVHLPIRNMSLPDHGDEKWRVVMPCLCNLLRLGQHVVIHCKEGVGRAGVVAARLLIELGLSATTAITMVRRARHGTLLLESHERYCYAAESLKNEVARPPEFHGQQAVAP